MKTKQTQKGKSVMRAVARLRKIQEKMAELLDEAESLVKEFASDSIYHSASSYWIAHARIAICDEHDYVAYSIDSMSETIEEMEESEEVEKVFSVPTTNLQRVMAVLRGRGIKAFPTHSPDKNKSYIRVTGTSEKLDDAAEELFSNQ